MLFCVQYLDTYLCESFDSSIIREEIVFPRISLQYFFGNLSLIKAEFDKKSSLDTSFSELLKKFLIEFESCLLSAKERQPRLMSCVWTHMLPIILLDIGKIGDKERVGR